VLAAQEHASQVGVLHAPPGLERRVEHRRVAGRADARVVEQDVDAPELVPDPRVHPAYLVLVGDVRLDRELADRAGLDVHAHDASPLRGEQPRGLGPDSARRARDHAHLAGKPRHHSSSVE
jgi:hypothetical protein